MTNVLATSNIVAREALAVLENMTSFAPAVNRDYEDEYGGNMARGYAPGATINIKRPPRYTYRAGRIAVPQATVEPTVPLTLSQGGTDINFNSIERTLSLTALSDKLTAAMAPVVNEIDRQGLSVARFATHNTLNGAGALPTTQVLAVAAMTNVNARLDIMGAPVKDGRRSFCMGPVLNGSMVQGFAGLFNMSERINGQYRTGYMQDSFGLRPMMDQNVDTHVNGAATATNINGANQTGSAITVVAVAGGTLTRGSVIQLPGVNSVNPQSRTDTGVAMDFVVTADALVGATTINVSPALVTSGPFQNVSASPTNTTVYVISGAASTAYKANIGFHKDAFTLAMVPLFQPPARGVLSSEQMSHNGFMLRVVQFYDGVNDNCIFRIDVLFGWAATYPELACQYRTTS
jgi:hypothetical protein